MRIVRGKTPARGFTIFRWELLRDERISERARGLLVRVLSYPDDWETDSTALAEQCREGRDAIRKAMRELEAAGYLRRERRRVERGRFVTDMYIYDRPLEANAATLLRSGESARGSERPGEAGPAPSGDVQAAPGTDSQASVTASPGTGFQSSEIQSSEIQALSTEDCYEDGLGNARGRDFAAPPDEDQETDDESWRQQDRRLFAELLGADCAKVVKHSTRWGPGHFTAQVLYNALAKPIEGDARQLMRYPGKVLKFKDETHQLEDWLWETGIEPCIEGHGKRRSA